MIAPILDQIAAEQDGKVKIGKINVDEENELAMKHEVVSIPTLALYKEGKLVQRQVGAIPKVQIEAMLGQA
jgi:thioredoxin 1